MDKKKASDTLGIVRRHSPKRQFPQTVDLILTLKDLDRKNPDHQITQFVQLHYSIGKSVSVCALVGGELFDHAKEVCNEAIHADDFSKFKSKKDIKKLAAKHDFFIAQATVMPKVATVFGKVLGPRGKMPNPKAGCVVPPNANLKPLYDRLQKTVRIQNKSNFAIQVAVGKEDTSDEEIIDNALTIYNSVAHAFPAGENNIKDAYLKLTMGPAFKVGDPEPGKEVKAKDVKKVKSAPEKKSEPENKVKSKDDSAAKEDSVSEKG